jgi:hypothetical protein
MLLPAADQNRRSHAETMRDNWLSQQALGALLHEERIGRCERAFMGFLLNKTLGLLQEKFSVYSLAPFADSILILAGNWPPSPSRSTTPMLIESQLWYPQDLQHRLNILISIISTPEGFSTALLTLSLPIVAVPSRWSKHVTSATG